jgi:hypothetical protein
MLPANYREVPFSDAVEHPNEAAIARYFDDLSGDFPETGTRWRSEMDSNPRCRRAFEPAKRCAEPALILSDELRSNSKENQSFRSGGLL